MSSTDAYHDTHPDDAYASQVNNNTISEYRHTIFSQDDESSELNTYEGAQMAEEQFRSQIIDPKPTTDVQSPPTSLLDNSTNKHSHVAAYAHNQNFQPGQSRGINHGLASFSSPAGIEIQSRTGKGVLPPRLSESEPSMGVGICYDNRSNGNGNVASYNPQVPTSMQTLGNGRPGATNSHKAGGAELNFRRSSFTTSALEYDTDSAFHFESHPGLESSKFMGINSNLGNPHGNLRFQAEAQVLDGLQIHEYAGAPSSGHTREHSLVLRNLGADAQNENDIDEYSDSFVNSPPGQDLESVADDNGLSRSEMRELDASMTGSRQFKRHFDRAAHRVKKPQQMVRKSPSKKSKGAADPVNTQIVDLYDNHNWSFAEIAQQLNGEQEEKGMTGTFTPNSVHNRYNRSAPVIYRADGRVFVAIRDRRHRTQEELDSLSCGANSTMWNEHMDKVLVQMVAKYDADKWKNVARRFNAATRQSLHPSTVSTRFGLLRK